MPVNLCFLCLEKKSSDKSFESVALFKMPVSQKTAQTVLQHLAKLINTSLDFGRRALLCEVCVKKLTDYDNLMVKLLAQQKQLTNQLRMMVVNQVKCKKEYDDSEESEIEDFDEFLAEDAFNQDESVIDKEESMDLEECIVMENSAVKKFESIMKKEDDYGEVPSKKLVKKMKNTNEERKGGRHFCLACSAKFNSHGGLQEHINNVHNPKAHRCPICGIVRKNEKYLALHMNVHEGKTETECRYCSKRFSRSTHALRHMLKHWDKKDYQCEKCGDRFASDDLLYNHRLNHEAEENPLICQTCNQKFKSIKTYKRHLPIHEENRKRYHCTKCPKSFTERYTLKQHMITHGEVLEMLRNTTRIPKCPVEDFVEIAAAPEVETIKKIHECPICYMKCESQEKLDKHLQDDHDVIK